MGLYASVCLVFGFDIGALPHPGDIHEIAEDAAEVDVASAEDGDHLVLYASGSYLSLLSHKTVEVPVLDVATVGAGVDVAGYREALRAFCETHRLRWSEPRWLIVSDVS